LRMLHPLKTPDSAFDVNYNRIGLPALVTSVLGLFYVYYLVSVIRAHPEVPADNGDPERKKMGETMSKLAKAISDGAKAFLHQEYVPLACVAAVLFILICVCVQWRTGLCYLAGVSTSATCGYLGMMISVYSNVRTATAAEKGLNAGLKVSFSSGCVMGLTVVCLGLGALSCLLMAFQSDAVGGYAAMTGFGMGASTVSIFARVGGGIFTKAADVGADLVGKVEEDFPEDDVRNPATIADNVGDNVGDVAGMGADLFSSYCGSIIATSVLGLDKVGINAVALPFWLSLSGIVCAIIGMLTVSTPEGADQGQLLNILRRAMSLAAALNVGCMAVIVHILDLDWRLFACLVIGISAGLAISTWSEYFTSSAYPPTRGIHIAGAFGPGNVIIEGVSVGSYSTIGPVCIIAGVIIAVRQLSGSSYGIALASTALLSTLGITLATDAYGPVADNAGGIAQMAHMPEHVRETTDVLDALGNTTAAVGKGFAVGSAVLTACSLLSTFSNRVGITSINAIGNNRFIPGVLIGAMIPYAFAAMTMGSVCSAAGAVVIEVRRQLREIPGLREGKPGADAEHTYCVTMVTKAALYSMVFPALLVVLSPIIIGVGLGVEMLAGLILGVIVSGFVLGCMMNTAGGAWDNAKKLSEASGEKGTQQHKSCVVGDTVGDPFKDTSGPAINILMKLMSYISVVLSPIFKHQKDYWWASLIVIGILIVFVPYWISIEPEGLRAEDRLKVINESKGQEQVKSTSAASDKKISIDDVTIELSNLRSRIEAMEKIQALEEQIIAATVNEEKV